MDANEVKIMTKILINRITTDFNHDNIRLSFNIYKIGYRPDTQRKSYGKIINTIYQIINPLSLTQEYPFNNKYYYVLLDKHTKIKSNILGDDFTIQEANAENISQVILCRLIVETLPKLINKSNQFCNKAGLYYLHSVEDIQGINVIRTLKIDISQDRSPLNNILLKIHGVTFTPDHYHFKDGELPKKLSNKPKFSFDEFSQTMRKDLQGEYIQKAHRVKRFQSDMITLSLNNIDGFIQSKMGVLLTFMADLEKYMGQYITIKFNQLESNYRQYFKDSSIKKNYTKINEIIKLHPINIINLINKDISELIKAFSQDDFRITESPLIQDRCINIVIHHDKEYYQEQNLEDPYASVHQKDIVTQSIIYDSLFNKGKLIHAVYEACKKELLIKIEVLKNQLLFTIPDGNWRFISAEKIKNELPNTYSIDDEFRYHQLDLISGKLSYKILNDDESIEELLSLPELPQKYWKYAVINLNEQLGYIIEETDYLALPEYEEIGMLLKKINENNDLGISKEIIREFQCYLNENKDHFKDPDQLGDKIQYLLNSHKKQFNIDDLRTKKLPNLIYKGDGKRFYDWLNEYKGILLATSLRSKERGLVEALNGLFYNHTEGFYYSGGTTNVDETIRHHNVIRRLVSNDDNVPKMLLEMMEEFHIKHKQSTVYPFLFKHLREYQHQEKMLGSI